MRDVLSPTAVATHPAATLAARLSADYVPLGAHLDRLLMTEQADGRATSCGSPRTRTG